LLGDGYQCLVYGGGQDGNNHDAIIGIAIVPTKSADSFAFLLSMMMVDGGRKVSILVFLKSFIT